jgi:hypothetical protein
MIKKSQILLLVLLGAMTWPIPVYTAQSSDRTTRSFMGGSLGVQRNQIGQVASPSGDQLLTTSSLSRTTSPKRFGIISNTLTLVQPGFSTSTTRIAQPGGFSTLVTSTQISPIFPSNRFGTTIINSEITANPTGKILNTTTILQPGFSTQTIRIGQPGQSTLITTTQIGNVFFPNPVGTFISTTLTPQPGITTFNMLDIPLGSSTGNVSSGTFLTQPGITTFNALDISLDSSTGSVSSGTFLTQPGITTFNALDIP